MKQNHLKKDECFWNELDLDYTGENNYASFFSVKSNIHSYPAKAVPNMVFTLLKNIKEAYDIKSVLDPFVGSGTTALEAKYLGLDFYGSDLNPLAVLLARTKILSLSNPAYIIKTLKDFLYSLQEEYSKMHTIKLVTFKNIEYWFKEENIKELSFVKEKINGFLKGKNTKNIESYALILLTAFSSSVRMCSLTRNSEFKLYRMSPSDINKFNVDAIKIFIENINSLIDMLQKANKAYSNNPYMQIVLDNAKELNFIKGKKVDAILTSPPYGDSRSTVAYGQFSRLSLQWISDLIYEYLDVKVYSDNCDEYLLGGKKSELRVESEEIIANSETLQHLMYKMDNIINLEVTKLNEMRQELLILQNRVNEKQFINRTEISDDLFKLIRERVRLDFYREFNETASFSRKEVKEISIRNTETFFGEFFKGSEKTRMHYMEILERKMSHVMETLKRKLVSVPKRKEEVLNFFIDLYQVIIRTDQVLNDNGVQAWIVGHRTVLGKININMKEILNDWFNNLNYKKVTDLTREYSFKRLPHHINSTVNRNDKIQTMMQEHILIVQKISE